MMGTHVARRLWFFAALVLFFTAAASGPALDFSFRPRGFALFPLDGASTVRYSTGGGGDAGFDVDLSSLFTNPFALGYTLGLEAGAANLPVNAGDASLSILSGGLNAGLYYYPLSRLLVRGEGAFGWFRGSGLEVSSSSWWWRAGAEAGFRVTPNFVVSAGGGFRSYNDRDHGGVALAGMYAGLTVQFNFATQAVAGSVDVGLEQDEALYPVFLSLYQTNPGGVLVITNRENAEIRDVRVSFRAGRYTASEFFCGSAPLVPRGRSARIPLLADFSPELLNFTGSGRIAGEAVVRYRILGSEREAVRSVRVQVHGRGAFRWNDPAALAGFVSPTFPEILEYSKYLTGTARARLRAGLNRNQQFAVYLFEGLRAGGTRLTEIPESPYREHRNSGELDTIQFPFQTLAYRSGDMDDVGILYAALLEAAGVKAAFIPLKDEFVTALSLGIDETQAAPLFNGLDRLLVVNGEVWLPLGMSAFNNGFDAAWEKAAASLGEAFSSGEDPLFIILEDAWQVYPPPVFPAQDVRYIQGREDAVVDAAERAMGSYISAELMPKIEALNARIRSGPSASLYNQLGNLYQRSLMPGEARAAWERAASMGSSGAMVNLGNLGLLDRDYAAAERWFRAALAASPENAAARRGLERAQAGQR
jgi:tetratricopeptide (TPR) repeat protein